MWNIIIREYAKNEIAGNKDILEIYYQMKELGIELNNFTFLFVLKACGYDGSLALQESNKIHDCITRNGFDCDVMYCS